MNIKTKDLELTKNEFFGILIENHFKPKGWVLAFILLVAFLVLFAKDRLSLLLPIFFFALWIVLLLGYYWQYSHSEKNKIFFIKRYYEINDEFLITYLVDGGVSKVKLDNIITAVKTTKAYFLFISQIQFFYLPCRIFPSKEDRDSFDLLLKNRKITGAKKKRPVGVTLLGIIFLLIGIPSLCLASIALISGFYNINGAVDLFIDIVMRILWIGSPILLSVSGVGLLALKKWGRFAALITAVMISLGLFVYGIMALRYNLQENLVFSSCCLIGATCFIFIIFYLNRAKVKAQFNSPQPEARIHSKDKVA